MPKRPDMSRIEKLFLAGNSFYLSRQQYISYTGADIPQNKSYTQAKSAIAFFIALLFVIPFIVCIVLNKSFFFKTVYRISQKKQYSKFSVDRIIGEQL